MSHSIGPVAVARTENPRPLRDMAASLRPQWPALALATLLAALATGCAIGLLATSGWLISRASQMPPVLELGVAIVLVRAFGIGRGVFRYTERLVSHDATFKGLNALRLRVYRSLEPLAPSGLAAFRGGDLLARLVADVDTVQDLSLRVLLPTSTALTVGMCSIAVAWWLLPAGGTILLVALLLGATLVPWVAVRTAGVAQRDIAPLRGDLTASITDLLDGSADLITCGASGRALDDIGITDAKLTRTARRTAYASGLSEGLGIAVAGLAVVASLIAGIDALRHGRLPGVELAVVVLLPMAAYESVVALPAAALALTRVRGAAIRVDEIFDSTPPVREPTQPITPAATHAHRLVMVGAGAAWPGEQRCAFEGVDLALEPGRRIALVGPSGAGKSSLVNVLLRFLEYSGSVSLDGIELRELAGDAVRRVVGWCAQDAHIFDSSVEQNLRIARPDASEGELIEALEQVRLREWLDALPDGLATQVGAHGGRMSGGERQRLALARLFLSNPDIWLLDEPTEHLDLDTADALTRDLLDVTTGRTSLLVTHRLTGLEAVDEIVMLDAGRIVERGSHSTLMNADGHYAELVRREARFM
jgi:thiol reductant ABC exporter CydC subunit